MRRLLTICCAAAVLLLGSTEGYADANKDRKITAGELHAYPGKNVICLHERYHFLS